MVHCPSIARSLNTCISSSICSLIFSLLPLAEKLLSFCKADNFGGSGSLFMFTSTDCCLLALNSRWLCSFQVSLPINRWLSQASLIAESLSPLCFKTVKTLKASWAPFSLYKGSALDNECTRPSLTLAE